MTNVLILNNRGTTMKFSLITVILSVFIYTNIYAILSDNKVKTNSIIKDVKDNNDKPLVLAEKKGNTGYNSTTGGQSLATSSHNCPECVISSDQNIRPTKPVNKSLNVDIENDNSPSQTEK